MNEINEITKKVLSATGVSLCEHLLMCTIGYSIFFPPQELVKTSASLNEGDPRGQFTPVQYRRAFQACIQKKWLQVITQDSFEQERNKRAASDIPEIYDSAFAPGVVDFTEPGYLLHRQIFIDIYGMERIQYNDSGWTIDEIHREVRIYAPTKELCLKRLDEFRATPSDFIGQQIKHVVEHDPEPIGSWKPNRFLVLSHGYYAVLQYQVSD